MIARYVRNLPIVRANYLGDRRVPDEMVDVGSQVFVSYPAKMGAAVLSAMAKMSVGESGEAKDARRLAEGVFEKLQSLTEPEGRPLAGFPRTYEAHPALRGHPLDMVTRHGGKVMMIYPREVADVLL